MSKTNKSNVPALPGKAIASSLARIRAARPASARPAPDALLAAAIAPTRRPRLVFAFDATASRQHAWDLTKKATDSLFSIVPDTVDIALAVHGGGNVHTFTAFSADSAAFRKQARAIECEAGMTALAPLMNQVLQQPAVKVMLYIGDAFEEDPESVYALADSFKARGIRTIMMHDNASGDAEARTVFDEIARRTGGVCVEFSSADAAPQELKDILSAVVVLTSGGIKLLEQQKAALPGAVKLLPYLK